MSVRRYFSSARARHGLALGALVLATGGLFLHRLPANASTVPHGTQTDPLPVGVASQEFSGKGLHGRLALSQGKLLANAKQRVFAEIDLAADPADEKSERSPVALAIVLDTSGSMSGDKIDEAKRAVLKLIADMKDDDQVSFVRYSDTSEVIQPLARVGTVRRSLEAKVRSITADGGTNIAPALETGEKTLVEATAGRVRKVVLVSDGLDGTRVQSETNAKGAYQHGIVVSSLGVGLDFDEAYMSSVARSGHGNFAFVKEGAELTKFFKRELDESSTTTVQNATITLPLAANTRFVRAFGAEAETSADGLKLTVGSLFAGDERRVIVELEIDTGAMNEIRPIAANLGWMTTKGEQKQTASASVQLATTSDRAGAEASRDGLVFANATSVLASTRQLEAADAYAKGDRARATALIDDNLKDIALAQAAAPPAAASAMARQAEAYADMKTKVDSFAPSSAQGRAAAKSATAKESQNLERKAF